MCVCVCSMCDVRRARACVVGVFYVCCASRALHVACCVFGHVCCTVFRVASSPTHTSPTCTANNTHIHRHTHTHTHVVTCDKASHLQPSRSPQQLPSCAGTPPGYCNWPLHTHVSTHTHSFQKMHQALETKQFAGLLSLWVLPVPHFLHITIV